MAAVAAAALLLLFCGNFLYPAVQNGTVEITVNGELYGIYALQEDRQLVIEHPDGGSNTVVVKDGTVYVSAADCPDKLCVKQGSISRRGQSVVCLPHGLVITVKDAPEDIVDM